MSRHRQTAVRPRYGRLAVVAASVTVTAVAVLGGAGLLPITAGGAEASDEVALSAAEGGTTTPAPSGRGGGTTRTDDPSSTGGSSPGPGTGASADGTEAEVDPKRDTALPKGTGSGKRIVFSQGRQRVWLVTGGKHVKRTYPVSGSIYDNLDPGTYVVYSRSEQAWGIQDSGTMRHFVRFTKGDNGAAIGFHDIPEKDGQPLQTEAQLGTPMSHGCIRQRRSDAVALWKFAPLGTTVVVTA